MPTSVCSDKVVFSVIAHGRSVAMAMDLSYSQSTRSRVSSICSQSTVIGSGSIGVRIGGLWKRSQGLSRFTKANYKHRVFILTDQALSYYAGTVDVSV